MQNSAIVKLVVGDAKAVNVLGMERALTVGDRVLFNERILTDEDGRVSIQFPGTKPLVLGVKTDVLLNASLLDSLATEPPLQDVDKQLSWQEDSSFDPEDLEQTAAGEQVTEQTANQGMEAVEVDYLSPASAPVSSFESDSNIFPAESPVDLTQAELILQPAIQSSSLIETGDVSYSYKSENAKEHSKGDESIVDTVTITAFDVNNLLASATLDILIVDTEPLAFDNHEEISVYSFLLVDNVIINQRGGNDIAKDDVLAADGGQLHSVSYDGETKEFLDPNDVLPRMMAGEMKVFIEFNTGNRGINYN